jgi:hypothetical protein
MINVVLFFGTITILSSVILGLIGGRSKARAALAIILAPVLSWILSGIALVFLGMFSGTGMFGAVAGVLLYAPGFFYYFTIPALVACAVAAMARLFMETQSTAAGHELRNDNVQRSCPTQISETSNRV